MPETQDADRRPSIILCAYDAEDEAWDPVEDLSGEPWSPVGARTVAVPAGDPERLAATLAERLRDGGCRALLLIGRTRADAFRVQMRAENRDLGGEGRQSRTGPGVARATAPVADIVRALREAGLAAAASSDAEDDAGSYLLYRVLADLDDVVDTPAIGLLRAPAPASDAAVRNGVKAAAAAMARTLPPLARPRAAAG